MGTRTRSRNRGVGPVLREVAGEAAEHASLGRNEAPRVGAAGVPATAVGMDDTTAKAVARSAAVTPTDMRALVSTRLRKLVVMLVSSSRDSAERLSQSLRQQRYDTRIVASLAGLDAALRSRVKVALVVIDLAGFDRAVWGECDRLQAAGIPFLLVADQRSPSIQKDSMEHGARGVFTKPVGAKELAEYVRATLGR